MGTIPLTATLLLIACALTAVSGKSLYDEASNGLLQDLIHEIESFDHHKRWSNEPVTIYTNATIYTVDKKDPKWDENYKDTIVVKGKKIAFVGFLEDVPNNLRQQGGQPVNMQRATIIPGLHDIHQHPLEAKTEAGASCFLNEFDSLEELAVQIWHSGCAYEGVDPNWALGHGHSIMKVLENRDSKGRTPREILDEAIPDIPAVMMEATSHSVWVNSKALKAAGIDEHTPDGDGGIIWRDENGKANGILLENWGNRMMSLALKSTPEIDDENYKGLGKAIKLLNRNGITSVCDARVYWQRGHDKIWKSMRKDNQQNFTIRAVMDLWAAPELDDEYQLAEIAKRYDDSDELLKFTGVKVYIDGLLQSTTAAMSKKYLKNNHFPKVGIKNIGINYFTEERLSDYMSELQYLGQKEGFDFNVHAIGDRGIKEVLNAINSSKIDENPQRPARHRLTHVEICDPADFGRFKLLNAIADFQVAGEFTLPAYEGDVIKFIGRDRAKYTIPVRSIAATGAMVTFSSDWDVSKLNPFIGLHNSMNREDQSVPIKKSLEMYTRNAAYVMRQEDKVGSLVVGKEADFAVIDTDIMLPENADYVKDTKVLETVFQGKTVFCNYKGC